MKDAEINSLLIEAEEERKREESERGLDSLVDSSLLSPEPSSEQARDNSKQGFFDRLLRLIGYHPSTGKKFEPRFNVREEFAVWMRNEFPLNAKCEVYDIPFRRRGEVYRAARIVCKHGMETTHSCVSDKFEELLDRLKDPMKFDQTIHYLVEFVERLSLNLESRQDKHYGTKIGRDFYR